jgi:hypothetical protein
MVQSQTDVDAAEVFGVDGLEIVDAEFLTVSAVEGW